MVVTRCSVILLLHSLAVADASFRALAEDSPSAAQIISDYSRAISEFEDRLAVVNGSVTLKAKLMIGEPEEAEKSENLKFARSSDNNKCVFNQSYHSKFVTDRSESGGALSKSDRSDRDGEFAFVSNKKYAMELARKSPADPFSIRYFGPDLDQVRSSIRSAMTGIWDCPISAEGLQVGRLINYSAFVVDRITEQPSAAGKRHLKIDFSIRPERVDPPTKVQRKNSIKLKLGWFLVSPDEKWALTAYRLAYQTPNGGYRLKSGSVEYDGSDSGFPVPKRLVQRADLHKSIDAISVGETDPKVKPVEERAYEFTSYRYGLLPEREFTAAAFGVPEIGEPGRRRYEGRTIYWLVGFAILAFASAITLRYYASRTGVKTT